MILLYCFFFFISSPKTIKADLWAMSPSPDIEPLGKSWESVIVCLYFSSNFASSVLYLPKRAIENWLDGTSQKGPICLSEFCNGSVTAAWKILCRFPTLFSIRNTYKQTDFDNVYRRTFWFELSVDNKLFFFLPTSRFNWQRKEQKKKKVSDRVAISVTASNDGGCWHSWYVEMRRLGCDHTDWSDVIGMLTKKYEAVL